MTRRFDLVVYGATSFVGQILCRVLSGNHQERWAMAGRSLEKLKRVREAIGAAHVPLLTADAADEKALGAMCEQANVVISTVGPYALYGEALVKVCATSGTDYCDLTGEAPWVRTMIDRYEAEAKRTGARLVNCCGFDSMPSDLGVHFVQKQALARFGQPCATVTMRVKAMRGGVSGGTAASMVNLVTQASSDASLRRELANPYSLCPPDAQPRVRQPSVNAMKKEEGGWAAPFVMAAINTRVVHRTNALSGFRYGRDFQYDEAMAMGRGARGWLRATALTAGLGAFLAATAAPPLRWLIEKTVLPEPGEGPSPEAQARGSFDFRFVGTTREGQRVAAKVTGDADPGYGSTAKMVAQAGVWLSSGQRAGRAGGFWTPASLMGDELIERLIKNAGLTFEVTPNDSAYARA